VEAPVQRAPIVSRNHGNMFLSIERENGLQSRGTTHLVVCVRIEMVCLCACVCVYKQKALNLFGFKKSLHRQSHSMCKK
jgi:hypothetical protein